MGLAVSARPGLLRIRASTADRTAAIADVPHDLALHDRDYGMLQNPAHLRSAPSRGCHGRLHPPRAAALTQVSNPPPGTGAASARSSGGTLDAAAGGPRGLALLAKRPSLASWRGPRRGPPLTIRCPKRDALEGELSAQEIGNRSNGADLLRV
jgi:hypothetical protein